MRFALTLAALAALAACATTSDPATPSAPSAPSASTQTPSRVAQMLSNAGRDNAPTQAEVTRLLGEPDIARQEGAGAVLTYRYENCALLLLFSADHRNAMRLREASPGPRRSGQASPSLEQCAAEAGARRS